MFKLCCKSKKSVFNKHTLQQKILWHIARDLKNEVIEAMANDIFVAY